MGGGGEEIFQVTGHLIESSGWPALPRHAPGRANPRSSHAALLCPAHPALHRDVAGQGHACPWGPAAVRPSACLGEELSGRKREPVGGPAPGPPRPPRRLAPAPIPQPAARPRLQPSVPALRVPARLARSCRPIGLQPAGPRALGGRGRLRQLGPAEALQSLSTQHAHSYRPGPGSSPRAGQEGTLWGPRHAIGLSLKPSDAEAWPPPN